MKKHTTLSLIAVALLGVAPPNGASQQEASKQQDDKTKSRAVRQEVADAAEAIKNYSADQRDEAAQQAKAALDALDARIEALEARIDKNGDKMDQAARAQARSTLKALRQQRIQVAEWYGGLKDSTTAAWDHMKKGFSDAYKSLRSSWEKAEREYQEDQRKRP